MVIDKTKEKKIEKIFETVKTEVKPDKQIRKTIESFLSKINGLLAENNLNARSTLGGSYAKGTYLKGDFDVDIFVRFDYSYKDDDLAELLAGAIVSLNPERLHGSRDYFQVKGNINYELIPVLEIENHAEAKNVTDMSPLHVSWVEGNIKEDQKDDIRLAKMFCKANRCYGAESYINGFSGHVLDILIIHYGSFKNLLIKAADWKKPVIIDHHDFYKGEALKKLNKAKIISPLIIIDPIMPERNAAAALSEEKFEIFREAAKRFLTKPDLKFFRKKVIDEKKLKNMKGKNKLLIFRIKAKEGKEDVIGSKLLKSYVYIKNKFENNTFTVLKSGWEWDKKDNAFLWYIAKNEFLEKSFLRVGPPLNEKYHVELFRKKHKKVEEKQGRIFAHVKRDFRKIEILAKSLLKSEVILEKVDNIELKFYR